MTREEKISQLSISDYNYKLPDERIAKYPLEQRDLSKLLIWNNGVISDDHFNNLPNCLPENSLLVFNNTKVIRARLNFKKETGARIEIFILDPYMPADYVQNFQQKKQCSWKCVVGNLKKWKNGKLSQQIISGDIKCNLFAENIQNSGGYCIINFSWDNDKLNFSDIIEAAGNIPIPPYLNRETEESDITRYQTIYSKIKGSVAAPTAGLHFTEAVFESLKKKGIKIAETTLHVGAGTFQPVKSELVCNHEMHTEFISFEISFLEKLSIHNGKIIAVGTTSIRTLESIYLMGCKVISNPEILPEELVIHQWEPYSLNNNISRNESLVALIDYLKSKGINRFNSSTQIIIVPGYTFKIVDGMITNFHQPKSTLLLLISAFIGSDWKKVYDHALNNNYRFLSYGDSNLYLK